MEWYLLDGGRVTGPFKAPEILFRLEGAEIDWHTLCCRIGDSHWKPLKEFKESIELGVKPDESLKEWILLTEKVTDVPDPSEPPFAQSGPYTRTQILEKINSAEAKYSDYIWKAGFSQWMRINEVDEFFKQTNIEFDSLKDQESSKVHELDMKEETSIPQDPAAQWTSDQMLLDQVLEQTQIASLDFIDDEARPSDATAIDQTQMKALAPKFVISDKVDSNTKFQLSGEVPQPNLETSPMPPVRANSKENGISKFFASNSFTVLMAALCIVMLAMVGIWFRTISNEREPASAGLPENVESGDPQAGPIQIQEKSEPRVDPLKDVSKKPIPEKPKIVKMVVQSSPPKEVLKSATLKRATAHLIEKAERLDREYANLKSHPLKWRVFYRKWVADLDKFDGHLGRSSLQISPVTRQIHSNRNRLGERAQMMNKAITRSSPVSSDFESENLPAALKRIQKNL